MKIPSKNTLKKYGLTIKAYRAIYKSQNGTCPICKRRFLKDVRAVIDHEHVKRYREMPFEKRSRYVRGLLCNYDNRRRVGRGMNLFFATNIRDYLLDYEMRSNPP